jgi:hypothetical protein
MWNEGGHQRSFDSLHRPQRLFSARPAELAAGTTRTSGFEPRLDSQRPAPQTQAMPEEVTFPRGGTGTGSAVTRFAVTPEELADKHPHLYRVTDLRNPDGIQKHGLLSTSRLLSPSECSDAARAGSESDNDRPIICGWLSSRRARSCWESSVFAPHRFARRRGCPRHAAAPGSRRRPETGRGPSGRRHQR